MEIEKCVIKHVEADMYYRPDISVGRMLKHTNIWEEPTVKYLIKMKETGSIPFLRFEFLDIGAHWGYYTVIVNALWPLSTIHAFEPFSENLEVLEKNCEGHDNIHIHPYGFAKESGRLPYWVGTMESGRGTFRKNNIVEIQERDPVIRMFELEVRPLEEANDVIWSNVGLIKIDVQGMEYELLREALHLVGQNSCAFIVENNKEVSEFVRSGLHDLFYTGQLLEDNNWVLMKRGGIRCPR